MPKLLDQVRQAIRRRHYSLRTEDADVAWVRRFILFHGKRHPAEMGEAEIVAFLSHPPPRLAARSRSRGLARACWQAASRNDRKRPRSGSALAMPPDCRRLAMNPCVASCASAGDRPFCRANEAGDGDGSEEVRPAAREKSKGKNPKIKED